jgi:hypothetical protein
MEWGRRASASPPSNFDEKTRQIMALSLVYSYLPLRQSKRFCARFGRELALNWRTVHRCLTFIPPSPFPPTMLTLLARSQTLRPLHRHYPFLVLILLRTSFVMWLRVLARIGHVSTCGLNPVPPPSVISYT